MLLKNATATLSIIIPVGPRENEWQKLGSDLLQQAKPSPVEIIFSGVESEPSTFQEMRSIVHFPIHWIFGSLGRAAQLNRGASAATGRFLWFLHADSRLIDSSISTLVDCLNRQPESLHFFDLRFLDDGPRLMAVNQAGVWFRSHLLKLPFGDQGFALERDLFWRLGGFSESTKQGEDHLFVWSARRMKVPLRAVGVPLYTSARRYRSEGWLRTTLRHLVLTFRQAIPQWFTRLP